MKKKVFSSEKASPRNKFWIKKQLASCICHGRGLGKKELEVDFGIVLLDGVTVYLSVSILVRLGRTDLITVSLRRIL